jgi:hypothetical protein
MKPGESLLKKGWNKKLLIKYQFILYDFMVCSVVSGAYLINTIQRESIGIKKKIKIKQTISLNLN